MPEQTAASDNALGPERLSPAFSGLPYAVAGVMALVLTLLLAAASLRGSQVQHERDMRLKLDLADALLTREFAALSDEARLAAGLPCGALAPVATDAHRHEVVEDGGVCRSTLPGVADDAWRAMLAQVPADGRPVLLPTQRRDGRVWWPVALSPRPGQVAVAAVDVADLMAPWSRFGLHEGSGLSVVAPPGRMLVRWPYDPAQVGRDVSGTPLWRAIVASPAGGQVRVDAALIDGVAREVTWRPLGSQPQWKLTAGVSVSHVWTEWLHQDSPPFAVAALLAGAALGWTWRSHRRLRAAQVARNAAEQALQSAEQRWVMALDASGLGVWDWDVPRSRVYFSAGWKRMLGHADTEVGDGLAEWSDRVHPEDMAQVTADVQAHLDGRTGMYRNEHRMRCADGAWKWILDQGQVVARDATGQPLRVVGTHTDMTAVHALQETRVARHVAEEASRQKTAHLARISHELRTPLNAVLGFAQLLDLDTALTPGQRERVRRILVAGSHLLDLINEVLDLSSAESGQIRLQTEVVDARALARECLAFVSTQAQRARVQVLDDTLDATPAVVRADPRRLRQVLINLLSNAVKYNRAGGVVALSLSTEGDQVVFAVRDTGPGLTGQQLSRLFEPFERLGQEHGEVEGTGIGLALTKRLVVQMGGEIAVDSQPGAGSRFTVRLPRAEAVVALDA